MRKAKDRALFAGRSGRIGASARDCIAGKADTAGRTDTTGKNDTAGRAGVVRTTGIAGVAVAAISVALFGALSLAGCGDDGVQEEAFGTNPITAESLEGLILEGEGPIPARLIYRSRNTISSEEDRLVLEAIAQELDRLVELAGRLDEAVTDETVKTDQGAP